MTTKEKFGRGNTERVVNKVYFLLTPDYSLLIQNILALHTIYPKTCFIFHEPKNRRCHGSQCGYGPGVCAGIG